jgi:phosphoribosylformylglycinamidine synthase
LGLKDAAIALSAPLVSGKDSMKNDYRGKVDGKDRVISVPPTLLVTAVGRMTDTRYARTSDFKGVGDSIYLLGGKQLGLIGSEYQSVYESLPMNSRLAQPDWEIARKIYSWLGGTSGKNQDKIKSLHDVSEGGMLVAVSESLLARNLGAAIEVPANKNAWEFCFGEGFHSFVASVPEASAPVVEAEWEILGVPFTRIGVVTVQEKLEVLVGGKLMWNTPTRQIQAAWAKEGYWE